MFCEWAETVQNVHRPAVLSRAAQARVSEVTVMLVAMLVRLFAHGSAANTAFARKSSAAVPRTYAIRRGRLKADERARGGAAGCDAGLSCASRSPEYASHTATGDSLTRALNVYHTTKMAKRPPPHYILVDRHLADTAICDDHHPVLP